MRILVLFDLPMICSSDLKEYRKFRKFLITGGFVMMQESVYVKLTLNQTVAQAVRESVRKNLPKEGLIQMLTVTERQFQNMELLSGNIGGVICESDKRYLEL